MINVFINPEHPALAIAVAAFISGLEEKYKGEPYEIIPIKTADLKKSIIDLKVSLNNEIEIALNSYPGDEEDVDDEDELDELEKEDVADLIREQNDADSSYYAFFGIHPLGKEEERIIFDFVEKYSDRILIWVDHHIWPENLLFYLKSRFEKVAIKNDTHYSDLLTELKINFPSDWIDVEQAIMKVDFDNEFAIRYWGSFLVSKSVGDNLSVIQANDCLLFTEMTAEILSGKLDEDIDLMFSFFEPMLGGTAKIIENINKCSCDNPIFEQAKLCGRPVGHIDIGEAEEYFDFRNAMTEGVRAYPWLFVISFDFRGSKQIRFISTKFPIINLTADYVKAGISGEELLKALNIELVNFKEP